MGKACWILLGEMHSERKWFKITNVIFLTFSHIKCPSKIYPLFSKYKLNFCQNLYLTLSALKCLHYLLFSSFWRSYIVTLLLKGNVSTIIFCRLSLSLILNVRILFILRFFILFYILPDKLLQILTISRKTCMIKNYQTHLFVIFYVKKHT